MIEEKESRIKYIGQIITLFALEILMLLFRIAVPVRATRGGFQWLVGEMIYMAIECFLIIILVNHLIFRNAYKEMGFTDFKENVFSLIGNLCYLGIAAGVTYGLNYISGEKNSNSIIYIISHVLVFFISTAFLQEAIFRGCILNDFLKLTGRKAFLSIIGATLLFMVVHVPLTMLETNFETLFAGQTNQLVFISFGIGIYLSLLYYWTKNLWICMIIHGTYSCIDVVAAGLLEPAFKGVYILGALIYLLYAGIQYMRGDVLEDDDNEEASDIQSDDNQNRDEEDQEEVKEVKEIVEEVEVSSAHVPVLEEVESPLEYQMIQGIEALQATEKVSHNSESSNKGEDLGFSEDLSKIAIIPIEEQKKDLSKTAIVTLAHQKEEQDKTKAIEKPNEEENKVDLNQTAIINLNELEVANKKDLNQTTIIKIAEIEAADKALKIEQLTSPHQKVEMVKFKEEPSYMNHLEHALGEFENIYKQVTPTDPPIDILSFQGERFNALVTNGMRYLPMNVPEYLKGNAYAELVMFIDKSFDISDEGLLKEENSWLLQSLRDLAMYPRLTNSYIGWGHVVGNGEERMPYYSGSELCGMLVYPPVVQEDMKFYTFKEGEKTTYIYNVMPLYTEEVDFILKHSSDAYFERIREAGISQIIKKNRPSACL